MFSTLMRIGKELFQDETGAVISAELAMVATLGVVGVTVSADAVSKSVNEELQDFAFAIRSLDQSFCWKPRESAGAIVAGSSFQQASVAESHAELRKHIAESQAGEQQRLIEAQKQRQSEPPTNEE